MRRLVLLAGILLLCLTARGDAGADEPSPEKGIDESLHHAETYYWFGMAERGNMAAYEKGLQRLAEAEAELEAASLDPVTKSAYRARIDALRVDLDEQAEVGHDTLNGVFPLFRFFSHSLFADQANLATFELLDDPSVMVTTAAAKQLAWVALGGWTRKAQLDAVFASTPRDEALENEALYVFNAIPKFFVHNQREVVDALTPAQRELFFAGSTPDDVVNALFRGFGVSELLVVLVRSVDVVDGDYFSIVEGRHYEEGAPGPRHRFQVMGFSRDRRAWFVPLIVTTILLLLFAYAAFAAVVTFRRRAATRVSPATYVLVPLLAFLIGRVTPWAIAPALRSFAPDPENLAIVSFWAPMTAGLLILALPMVLYWIVATRLSRLFSTLAFEGRGAAACVAIGAGVVAYLALPAYPYLEAAAIPVLLVLTVGVTLIAFLLGRALDPAERFHGGFAVLACLLAMGLISTFLLGSLPWLVGATLFVGLCFAGVQLASAPVAPMESRADTPAASRATGEDWTDTGELAARAMGPTFQATPGFEKAWERLAPFRAGNAMRLGLVGGAGSGLSRCLEELTARLESSATQADRSLLVLHGRARASGEGGAPYAPFREALARHFAVDLLVTSESDAGRIDSSLGGLLESLVPFGSLLVPSTSDLASQPSRQNLFGSILWALRRLARKQPVALVLDNVQDFDAASDELLAYLTRHIPVGSPEPVLLLAGSHKISALQMAGFEPDRDVVTLRYPSVAAQVGILTDGVGLDKATADALVDRVGSASESTRGMTWLLQVVGDFARAGHFRETPDGFGWPEGAWPIDVELPDEMGDVVRRHVAAFPAYRRTLAAAACAAVGRSFDVQTLSEVLDRPRLDVLTELDSIQTDTGIVYDDLGQDDVYAFSSRFMLEVVREELDVPETGSEHDEVPQVVRELHRRTAAALEEHVERDHDVVHRVADHYFAAGSRHAGKALQWGLRAARGYAAAADFDGADRELTRAEALATAVGRADEAAEQRLAIELQRAHVTGDVDLRVRAAEDGAAFLKRRPDASIQLLRAIGQAHYDAGKSTGDRSILDEATRIGRVVVERATTPAEEAAGHHLVGVSLPDTDHVARIAAQERALEILLVEGSEDADGAWLTGRVLGSLAEEHMRGEAGEIQQAKALLHRRLELINASGVGDPRSLAMTHGALGRLSFFIEPRDVSLAREHFAKDLEISEAIGDFDGQVQMHSLLGACALEEGDTDTARAHYEASWKLGTDPIARTFAGAGLLRVHANRGDSAAVARVAAELEDELSSASTTIPDEAAAVLREALEVVPGDLHEAALEALAARVRPKN